MSRPSVRSACTIFLIALLAGCTAMPQPESQLPGKAREIRYLGEISGKLGSRPLLGPRSLTLDQSGNLYIADTGNNRIVKLDREFAFIAESGGFGSESGGLNRPVSIVSDDGIDFFVLDQGNRRVVKLDYNLVISDEIIFDDDAEYSDVGQVTAIGFSRYAKLYLVDPDNLRVLVLDSDYALESELSVPGGFSDCQFIAVAPDGGVSVYDRRELAVFVFDAFGSSRRKVELSGVAEIGGFAVSVPHIIASDSRRNELAVFSAAGLRETAIGSFGDGPYNLNAPTGIALRFDGKLFVCDSGNNRITYYEILSD